MTLTAKVVKRTRDSFQFKISKENLELFCDSIGLYRREFLESLDASLRRIIVQDG
jgi:hypothetical protein